MATSAAVDRFLRKFWSVGLVSFAASVLGAVIVKYVGEPIPRATSLSLLVALVGTNVARLITDTRDTLAKRMDALAATASLGRLFLEIDDGFLRYAARRLLLADVEGALSQLATPAHRFDNQSAYMLWAEERLCRLGPGDEVLAICGEKDWNSGAVKRFNEANCAASRRGARVERIFLQLKRGGFSRGEREVIDLHCRTKDEGGNIEAFILPLRDARRILSDYSLPKGFGLTYIRKGRPKKDGAFEVVLVHWGLSAKRRDGLWVDSPVLIKALVRIFYEVRSYFPAHDG